VIVFSYDHPPIAEIAEACVERMCAVTRNAAGCWCEVTCEQHEAMKLAVNHEGDHLMFEHDMSSAHIDVILGYCGWSIH
jgi:hypothetical protein